MNFLKKYNTFLKQWLRSYFLHMLMVIVQVYIIAYDTNVINFEYVIKWTSCYLQIDFSSWRSIYNASRDWVKLSINCEVCLVRIEEQYHNRNTRTFVSKQKYFFGHVLNVFYIFNTYWDAGKPHMWMSVQGHSSLDAMWTHAFPCLLSIENAENRDKFLLKCLSYIRVIYIYLFI